MRAEKTLFPRLFKTVRSCIFAAPPYADILFVLGFGGVMAKNARRIVSKAGDRTSLSRCLLLGAFSHLFTDIPLGLFGPQDTGFGRSVFDEEK